MNDLIADYLRLAEKWGGAMDVAHADDAKAANALFDRMEGIYAEIASAGHELELLQHADHQDDAVALCLAYRLMQSNRSKSLELHQRLANSDRPFVRASAGYVLKAMQAH